MEKIIADFGRDLGRIKPLHGVNNSPMVYNGSIPEFRDAGIPFVRLHDTGGAFGGTYLVDVPNIFLNFDADEEDPASYDFAYTDAYFQSLVASGCKIFYRLGVTIENNFRIKPHRIVPPADFAKWARICEHIVRHYNEGWADGFHCGIEYWEIWNEPENPPMWTGTMEDYFRLYGTAANHLKKCFPNLKIGGYAGCGFYGYNRPGSSDFEKSFLTWFDEFLKYVTAPETKAPLDFFSWHLYTADPHETVMHAYYVDERLKKAGFTRTESICDEWNLGYDKPGRFPNMKTMTGAAFTAAQMILFQRSPVDKAMYYDALPTRAYCGLFTFPEKRLTRTYFAFKAFNELYRLGTEVYSSSGESADGVYALGARSTSGEGALLVVNRGAWEQTGKLELRNVVGKPTVLLLDQDRTLTETGTLLDAEGNLTLPAESLVLIRCRTH